MRLSSGPEPADPAPEPASGPDAAGRRTPPELPGLPSWSRCAVMGVVNVTPDSFSDGGLWFAPESAVKHGLDLVAAGADLVDVGGESTRPGASRVDEAEELRRVIPVVRELAAEGVTVSVDTMRATVAARAVEAGARLVNDVSGGRADSRMVPVVAELGVPYVVMHWRGQSVDMNDRAVYRDVVGEVLDELRAAIDDAVAGGIESARIVVDPGLGFAKQAPHDLALVAGLRRIGRELDRPLLVAASRKRFLGRVLAGPDGTPPPARQRDAATAAVTALAARDGAWAVRVHEVPASADAVRVAAAVAAAGTGAGPVAEPGQETVRDTGTERGTGTEKATGTGTASGVVAAADLGTGTATRPTERTEEGSP